MAWVRIAEIYRSRQGEGLLTGTPSGFVRTSGCNLRCWYCDTPYTSWAPEGDDLPVDEIFHRVTGLGCPHVVVTGGEPMLHAELVPLCESFRSARLHTTIETAGTLYLPVACDLMSISPKRANSRPPAARDPYWHVRHERARHVPKVIRQLMAEYDYQFKFVVDELEDCADVLAYLREFPEIDPNRVMLMPQGTDPAVLTDRAEWLVPFCRDHGLTFCPRKHIEWFGFVRGS